MVEGVWKELNYVAPFSVGIIAAQPCFGSCPSVLLQGFFRGKMLSFIFLDMIFEESCNYISIVSVYSFFFNDGFPSLAIFWVKSVEGLIWSPLTFFHTVLCIAFLNASHSLSNWKDAK